MKKFWWLFLVSAVDLASSASHSLQYHYTAVTPGLHSPEFISEGLLDGEQVVYYDGNIRKKIPKTEWMEKNEREDYWKTETETSQHHQEEFRHDLINLMKRFNQTGGFHTVQQMYGCELDTDGAIRGHWLYGYDGEDFISFDLNTETWTAAHPKAVITKRRWDSQKVYAAQVKAYLLNECTAWLQKYVEYGRSSLERKVRPEASLFQKDSSSPVVCHATGFFPKEVNISWQKNGEDLHEDVELSETLPNQDGTFQKRSVLTVSPEELKKNEYTCVVQHSGLEKEVVLRASGHTGSDDATTGHHQFSDGTAVGLVLVLLLVLVGIVFMWRRMKT
ncbi:H-2 class I histocompatibility antigen, Q9 alpha chain-like [Pygocentrus nattereri]|uniref:H-2 class I histocompatibility antigen, Q9 alpha chain-like n=1 Tax=Pygocentrus nattereri TaxID=42514 RepID=UPI0018918628|nr:H-2 class I histocompatibility antigen, Q9 alpha chain-like [Pygocentrus nattereri]XP_037387191.1 H-2 class I histocompatibility antigen, Q9 alpha chain-like [Pygocentrus nattereri]